MHSAFPVQKSVIFTEGMVVCHTVLVTWRGSGLQPILCCNQCSTSSQELTAVPLLSFSSPSAQNPGSRKKTVSHLVLPSRRRLDSSAHLLVPKGSQEQHLSGYLRDSCSSESLYHSKSGTQQSPPEARGINRNFKSHLLPFISEIFPQNMPAFMQWFFSVWFCLGFFRENVCSLFWLPRRPRKSLYERSDETKSRRRRSSCEGLCQCSE